ncbi:TadE/TadG family type IV pilus assembly protein [Frankia sp. Cj3]|uniref:TadE/TadG family type IV pilus assembly protein n=1 Tax=Frankia sp. Cj3 TaxID=2880976 RepID=UPI001EF53693|nr:TadE/TadG family type IV pilus assembly protein [Frankia sp. Cj3]
MCRLWSTVGDRRTRTARALRRRRGERGSAAAELAVATPLLLLLLLLIVQFAVWMHATHIAQTAAAEAVEAARAAGGTTATGQSQARTVLSQVGVGVLTDPQITVTVTGDSVHVTVDGHVTAVVPGVRLPVHAAVSGVQERFRPPVAGGDGQR